MPFSCLFHCNLSKPQWRPAGFAIRNLERRNAILLVRGYGSPWAE